MRFVDKLLITYARKLEDENAPEFITIAMREGADAIRQLDDEVKFLRAALAQAADDLDNWGGYVNANTARAALEVKS